MNTDDTDQTEDTTDIDDTADTDDTYDTTGHSLILVDMYVRAQMYYWRKIPSKIPFIQMF